MLNYLPEFDLQHLVDLHLLNFIAKVNPKLKGRVAQLQISFLQHQEHHFDQFIAQLLFEQKAIRQQHFLDYRCVDLDLL